MRSSVLLVATCLAAGAAEATKPITVQDFEHGYTAPGESKGALSSAWHADGQHSLIIPSATSGWVDEMQTHDWSAQSALRLHFNNPGAEPAVIDLWIRDHLSKSWWDWHLNAFTLQPGEQTITLDYSEGRLWRSETGLPYRGEVKTPIDVSKIRDIGINNKSGSAVYVDAIELVAIETIRAEGGFAFDFGSHKNVVMSQFTGVYPDSAYAPGSFGFLAGDGRTLSQGMVYPSHMLGDGIAWSPAGFAVDLRGGDYVGFIAFERGGFWGSNESATYTTATVTANGATIHEHTYNHGGLNFLFEDTEVTSMVDAPEKLIFPAHVLNRIAFTAVAGKNVFTLAVENPKHFPLRVAGLVIAPATSAGKAFIERHLALQKEAIATVFPERDRSRRDDGRKAPDTPLVWDVLEPGAMVYPRDFPSTTPATSVPEQYAVQGQTVCIHLGLYAQKAATLAVSASPLCSGAVKPVVSHGRYLPDRPAGIGTAWIDINHYRPEPTFTIAPDIARSVIIEYPIPIDATAGTYSSTITIAGAGSPASLPVKIHVAATKLANIPIPIGLFANALPMYKDTIDEATFWRLQEDLFSEQFRAGQNMLTGGGTYQYANGTITGDDAIKAIRIAQKHGTVRAVLNYGGFLPPVPLDNPKDAATYANALKVLEETNQLPPHFVNSYDEPNTEAEMARVMSYIATATHAGIRTLGFTSVHEPAHKDWMAMVTNTHAPALNLHTPADIKKLKDAGCHPWVYNQGADRYGSGIHLWRNIKAGAEGRCDWIGCQMEGFAFYDLDGREPSTGCFAVHSKLGTLKTPNWLGRREGLLDCRIRLTLEGLAKADDPALQLWTMDGYRTDRQQWQPRDLQKTRVAMLKRIEELSGR
jgi:hypothetical protein